MKYKPIYNIYYIYSSDQIKIYSMGKDGLYLFLGDEVPAKGGNNLLASYVTPTDRPNAFLNIWKALKFKKLEIVKLKSDFFLFSQS